MGDKWIPFTLHVPRISWLLDCARPDRGAEQKRSIACEEEAKSENITTNGSFPVKKKRCSCSGLGGDGGLVLCSLTKEMFSARVRLEILDIAPHHYSNV